MNAITVDNRGLPCPQPVIQTKKALNELAEGQSLVSIVDNDVAKENVLRFAANAGCHVQIDERDGLFYLTLKRESQDSPTLQDPPPQVKELPLGQHVLFLRSNLLGLGSDELGALLMRSFFYAVNQTPESLPAMIVLINSGVLLAVEDSPVLADLQSLNQNGVDVVACGTCLDFYAVKDQLRVGRISNMYDIYEILAARRVITL
jgi:tRNA 2-thiouridine synthesizing protein A